MAYEKQTWVDGVTPLDAEHLNHMEQGISQFSAGEPGGWYTPEVKQPINGAMVVNFTPSKEGMPDVPAKSIILPQGETGATGATGPKGDKGAAGKSAYQYAQEGGYTGTETAFAEKLAQEQLTGTTNDLTPAQVYEAVSAGIPVKVQYTDSTYGLISFTAFNVAESLSVIASQTIVYYNGVYILAELFGDKSKNSWGFKTTTLAQKADIPSALPNPNALTFTGAVTGSYDGSAAVTVEIPSGGGGSGSGSTISVSDVIAETQNMWDVPAGKKLVIVPAGGNANIDGTNKIASYNAIYAGIPLIIANFGGLYSVEYGRGDTDYIRVLKIVVSDICQVTLTKTTATSYKVVSMDA